MRYFGRFCLLLVFLPGCFAARAKAQRDVRCRSEDGVFPAGVYWVTSGWYEEHLDCPRPGVALVEGVHSTGRHATRALRSLRGVAFEPGYPWAVHTRYVGLEGDGVALVLGLFEDEAQARRWSESRRPGASVHTLSVLSAEDTLARRRESPVPTVTHIAAPAPVPAYRTRAALRMERGRPARAACHVHPSRVFVFSGVPNEHAPVRYWRWLPVRCGGQIAWVGLTHTTAAAVTWSDGDGDAFISQVTSVECDTPTHTEWAIDERRHRTGARVVGGRGCGP